VSTEDGYAPTLVEIIQFTGFSLPNKAQRRTPFHGDSDL
jgi:hypothetical protein